MFGEVLDGKHIDWTPIMIASTYPLRVLWKILANRNTMQYRATRFTHHSPRFFVALHVQVIIECFDSMFFAPFCGKVKLLECSSSIKISCS